MENASQALEEIHAGEVPLWSPVSLPDPLTMVKFYREGHGPLFLEPGETVQI